MTVRHGDQMPHFEATGLDGRRTVYRDLWQRKNVLLVVLPDDERASSSSYAKALADRMEQLTANDTAVVLTRDRIPNLPSPGLVIADRWGEIALVRAAGDAAQLPDPEELVEWLRFVQMRCPECEGECR